MVAAFQGSKYLLQTPLRKEGEMQALGRQILVELYNCNANVLNDKQKIREVLMEGTRRSGATIVSDTFHLFNPHGVSGVVVIAESHVAIHTWPEYGYAAVDIFTCGESIDPWVIMEHLKEGFGAGSVSNMELKRGLFPEALAHKPPEAARDLAGTL
jgi:S-adenosylmethionine decarboxylase